MEGFNVIVFVFWICICVVILIVLSANKGSHAPRNQATNEAANEPADYNCPICGCFHCSRVHPYEANEQAFIQFTEGTSTASEDVLNCPVCGEQ